MIIRDLKPIVVVSACLSILLLFVNASDSSITATLLEEVISLRTEIAALQTQQAQDIAQQAEDIADLQTQYAQDIASLQVQQAQDIAKLELEIQELQLTSSCSCNDDTSSLVDIFYYI